MAVSSWYLRLHWRLFSVMVRLFGVTAFICGAAFLLWGVYQAFDPRAAEGIETGGLPASAINMVLGSFSLAVGTAVLRAQPYRPDLGDAAWTFRAAKPADAAARRRNWWTGEPRAGSR